MSILTLGSKKEEKENFQSKEKREERKFPIKEWEKEKEKKEKKRKYIIKKSLLDIK